MQVLAAQLLTSRDHFWSRNPRPKMVSGGDEFMQVLVLNLLTSRNHFWSRNPRPKMVSGIMALSRP